MTRWQVTRLDKSLGEHAADWDALNQHLFNGHPMLGSCFVEGLLKHFGDGTEHLCVLAPHGVPEAMCLLTPAGFGVWRTFLPSQAQLGPVLIPKIISLTGLMNSLPGFVISLHFLCNDPQFGDLSTGVYATSIRMDHALTMCIRIDGSFEEYWAQRSRKLVQNVGRYQRRLEADKVTCKFVCIAEPDDIPMAVARYAALESKGWKGKAGTALGDNAQEAFYNEVLCRYAHAGHPVVYELWFNDQLVASRLIINGPEVLVTLKTTYDESQSKYAPGRLLLLKVIEVLFSTDPGKTIEFYTDATPDQLAWATGQRWITHWSFYKNRYSADLFTVISAARKALVNNASTAPLLGSNQSVEVFQHPDQLPTDVQQLFENTEHDNFQCGVPWFTNLTNIVYAKGSGVHIYVLRCGGYPIAALPIVATMGKLGCHIHALGNYYTSVYAPPIAPGVKYRDFAKLLNAVKQAHAPVTSMRFEPMDPDSIPYRRLWNALQANGMASFRFFCFGNWYLTGMSTWQNYLNGRDGQLRSTIKRATKKFMAVGGTMELVRGGTELERGLAAYEQVYAKSWKQPEPYPTFMPGLIRTSAAHGWLRLGVAWLDGTPIAAQVWIVANGKANIYKLAYDEAYKVYGSGTVLTAMLMEHVIEKDNVDEVDYLTGDDPYKKAWMSDRRERWGIIAYNPKTLSGLAGLTKEVFGRLLKSVKKNQ